MMSLHWLIFGISVALQILLLNSLRRSVYKDYAVVFGYSLVLFLTTIADGAVFSGLVPLSRSVARLFFYRNEAIRQTLLFIVVLTLIDRAMRANPYRGRVRVILIVAVIAAVSFSVEVHADSSRLFGLWVTEVIRDLSMGSVVLTLVLWLMLISSKKRDPQLLLVTGGLGLQFTGEAVGQSLRQISQDHFALYLIGNLMGGVTHLLRLYVWREAFRRPREPLKPNGPEGESQKAFPPPAQELFEPNP
jgi:hypothetical protein